MLSRFGIRSILRTVPVARANRLSFPIYSTVRSYTKNPMSEVTKSGCSCTGKKERIEKVSKVMGPVEKSLCSKIKGDLDPEILIVKNDSWKHSHHSGMKGAENISESHFHVTIVSDKFKDAGLKTSISRHRYIFKLLDDDIKNGIHGFQVVCKTPEEWQKIQEKEPVKRESSERYFS